MSPTRRYAVFALIFLLSMSSFVAFAGRSFAATNISTTHQQSFDGLSTIGIAGIPQAVATDSANGMVYVPFDAVFDCQLGISSGGVSIINPKTNTESTVSGVSFVQPIDATYDPAANEVWVLDENCGVINGGSAKLLVLNATTNGLVTSISLGANGTQMAYDPANQEVFVGSGTNRGILWFFDGVTNQVLYGVTLTYPAPSFMGLAYDPSNQQMYVSVGNQGYVYTFDSNDQYTHSIPGPTNANFMGLAYDPVTSTMWVTDSYNNAIDIIDSATSQLATTICDYCGSPGASWPIALTYNPLTESMYVANQYNGDVAVFSAGTNPYNLANIGTDVFVTPASIVYDSVSKGLYVANGGSADIATTVTFIGGRSFVPTSFAYVPSGNPALSAYDSAIKSLIVTANEALLSIPSHGTPQTVLDGAFDGATGIAYDNSLATGMLFVGNYGNGTVTVLNATNFNVIVPPEATGVNPNALVYDPYDQVVFVANTGSNTVSILGGSLYNLGYNYGVISGFNAPVGLAFDALNRYVYVSNSGNGTVSIINTNSFQPIATVSVGATPLFLAYSPNNKDIYVPNNGDGTISVISSTSNKVTTLSYGSFGPWAAAFDQANGDMYITNQASDSVLVLDGGGQSVAVINMGIFGYAYPFGAGYDPANHQMYIMDFDLAEITVTGS